MSFKTEQRGLAAMPLSAVTAVFLDTETTGLDTENDRVIEIAAVRVKDGRLVDDSFETFVNPLMPVPPESTEIHGITDVDVADAPGFAEAVTAFSKWAGSDVIMGYSIGFDVAVMASEHKRQNLKWSPPRCLDVRHLIKLVAPDLPQETMEVAADWLKVEITARHRALGDAKAAAEIFLALVPKLKQNNIVTLAEAGRNCRRLSSRLNQESQAGWHELRAFGTEDVRSVGEYARIDSFAYRHQVADVMHSPPEAVEASLDLGTALHQIVTRKISSLFVHPDGPDGTLGILTERDVLRALDGGGPAALTGPVGEHASKPLVTIRQDEYAYRAMTMMSTKGFRHLGVVDDDGNLVGALSARDLLKQRAGDAIAMDETIDHARTPAELGRIWGGLTTVARGLVFEEVDPRDTAGIVSRELRALTRRACELAEEQMEAEGHGGPPVPYAMLVLGSGGRGESLLAMDQDNAIVYTEGKLGSQTDWWFERLGSIVADTLNDAGVIYCPGGIMAKNEKWRMDVKRWNETVESWITHARPEDLLNTDIFFDAVPVHGEEKLGFDLHGHALALATEHPEFANAITRQASNFDTPIGMFGRIKTDDGRVDLKKSGIMPIFSAARVLALRLGISARATPARLLAARDHDVPGAHLISDILEAHRVLLGEILKQQLRDIERGIKLSNKVALAELASHETQELKWALDQSSKINDLMGTPARL